MPNPETSPATTPFVVDNVVDMLGEVRLKVMSPDQLRAECEQQVDWSLQQGGGRPTYRSPSNDEELSKQINDLLTSIYEQKQADLAAILQGPYTPARDPNAGGGVAVNRAPAGDPVNLFNGEFAYAATDFRIDGAGFDLEFTRSYTQSCSYVGPLGSNWDHAYNLWLRVPGDGTVLLRSNGALGQETYLRHELHGYWLPVDGGHGVVREVGASFVFELPGGTKVLYQPHPTLHPFVHVAARVEDRFGNGLTFAYNDGLLERIQVNHPARVVDFSYDTAGRIRAIRDHTAREWRYDYDDLGDLVAVTSPSTAKHPRGLTTGYGYSTAAQTAPELQHLLTSVIDADGRLYLENQYGLQAGAASFRRVVAQRQGTGETTFDYENVIEDFDLPYASHERPTHQTILTERDGHQARYLFNDAGHMLFKEAYARLGGLPRLVSWHYRYNRDGRLVGSLSPLGSVAQTLYRREAFERRFPPGNDYRPEADANLTSEARLEFEQVLATVRRGRYQPRTALNLSGGLWSQALFPDIFDTRPEDIVQKFTYEPAYGQPLTVSDPRFTESADPGFVEGPEYHRHLTRLTYSSAADHVALVEVAHPTPTMPDGSTGPAVGTRVLARDGRGRVTRIRTPNGAEVVHTYAGAGAGVLEGSLVSTTLDPTGLNLTSGSERDPLARPIKVLRPSAYDSNDGRFVSTIEYDNLGQILTSRTTPPFSVETRNTYSRTGAVARSETDHLDENGALLETVASSYRYDDEQHVIRMATGDLAGAAVKRARTVFDRVGRPSLSISPSGRIDKVSYNERALLSTVVRDHGGIRSIARIAYDADGRPVRQVDPRGNASLVTYDALDRVIAEEDALGNRTTCYYDKLGNVLVECHFEKDGPDNYRLLARAEHSYDELGRLTVAGLNRFEAPPTVIEDQVQGAFRQAGPGRLITTQRFLNVDGAVTQEIDPHGRRSRFAYDLAGRLTTTIDPLGNELAYHYDKEGNVLRVDRREATVDPATGTVERVEHFAQAYAYDELNRLIESRTSTGAVRYRYDSRGNPVEVEDPLGHRSRATYDVFGRLVTADAELAGQQPGDAPQQVTTTFRYDLEDRPVQQVDARGLLTHFEYDTAGRLVSTRLPDGTSDRTAYDRADNLVEHRDRNGIARAIEWDALGRPVAVQIDITGLSPLAQFSGAVAYRAEFDSLDRRVLAANEFIESRTTYDSLGLPLREATQLLAAAGGDPTRDFAVLRSFSDDGALTRLTYPSGRTIVYERDDLDRVTSVKQAAKGSGYPGNAALAGSRNLATATYGGLQLRQVRRGNGASSTYSRDFTGRVVDIQHELGPESLLRTQLLYDSSGNLRQRVEQAKDFDRIESFAYDSLDRLVGTRTGQATAALDLAPVRPPTVAVPAALPNRQAELDALVAPIPSASELEYRLDPVGNRVAREAGNTLETYDGNELDQYRRVGTDDLRYDPSGNLVEDTAFTYAYDHLDRITRVLPKGGGDTIDIFRDVDGRAAVVRQGSQVEARIFDGDDVLEDYLGGQLRRSFVYGPDGTALMSAVGGADLELLGDLSRSVRYVVDGATRRNFYVYDEFGNMEQSLPGSDDNVLRYAGKRELGSTGMLDLGARLYDPRLGRFVQRDPAGYVDGTNLYTYAQNSPLVFGDPDGFESRSEQSFEHYRIDRGDANKLKRDIVKEDVGVGDVARTEYRDVSAYELNAVGLRAHFTALARGGPLTDFENRLVSVWGSLDQPRLVPISHIGGKGVDAYRLVTGSTGRTEKRIFTRTGELLSGGVSESALINMGIGPVEFLIPSFRFGRSRGIRSVARGRAATEAAVTTTRAASASVRVVGITKARGYLYLTGNRFLDFIGYRTAKGTLPRIKIRPGLPGKVFDRTVFHEAFHAWVVRKVPSWAVSGSEKRWPIVQAFAKYAEETAAYGYGSFMARQYGRVAFAPLEAFKSLSVWENLSVIGATGGLVTAWKYRDEIRDWAGAAGSPED